MCAVEKRGAMPSDAPTCIASDEASGKGERSRAPDWSARGAAARPGTCRHCRARRTRSRTRRRCRLRPAVRPRARGLHRAVAPSGSAPHRETSARSVLREIEILELRVDLHEGAADPAVEGVRKVAHAGSLPKRDMLCKWPVSMTAPATSSITPSACFPARTSASPKRWPASQHSGERRMTLNGRSRSRSGGSSSRDGASSSARLPAP